MPHDVERSAADARPAASPLLGAAYAVTVFLSAFLLFQVQPLISKSILPWFGGTPGVWTTCMLFFQLTLFAGYAYAHLAAVRFTGKVQMVTHSILLVAGLAVLPIIPDAAWKPNGDEQPIWRIVSLLTASVGLPFFILSTTGPLLQHWYSRTHQGLSPYRLYALSNVGSLLALVSYPFLFEPMFSTSRQAVIWSWGFGAFAALCAVCAWGMATRSGGRIDASEQEAGSAESAVSADAGSFESPWTASRPTFGLWLLWFILAMIPSVLLLATTNQVCLDVASIPFLWVVPLSLYLLSFILCFDSDRWYSRRLYFPSAYVLVGCSAAVMIAGAAVPILWQVLVLFGTLFVCAMVCHGELAHLRPHPRYLTAFYLVISAGGAAGGIFVGVLAPELFPMFLELHLGLIGFGVLSLYLAARFYSRNLEGAFVKRRTRILIVLGIILPVVGVLSSIVGWLLRQDSVRLGEYLLPGGVGVLMFGIGILLMGMGEWRLGIGTILCSLVVALAGALSYQVYREFSHATATARNFYGVLRVQERSRAIPYRLTRELLHGRILHGTQILAPKEMSVKPTTYYGNESGVGLVFGDRREGGPLRAGLVGLGSGTLATYARPGDEFRIYDINPEVVRIANEYFTYLHDCQGSTQIVLGDARLSMEREESQQFDILVLDAFSSDAIPVHLLTVEAFAIYLKHLKQDGVLAIHISNRHFDLRPIVEALADYYGLHAAAYDDDGDDKDGTFQSSWVLVSRDLIALQCVILQGTLPEQSKRILWTDDNSNLFRVLKHRNPEARNNENKSEVNGKQGKAEQKSSSAGKEDSAEHREEKGTEDAGVEKPTAP